MKANFSTFYLDLFSLLRIFIFFAISQIIPHMKLLIPVCCGYHNFLHWPNTQNIIISQTESWINLSLQEYTVTRYTLSLYLSRYTGHEVYSLSISFATLSRGILSLYLSRYTVTKYTLSLSLSLHCHEVYPLSISLATLSRGILSLYFSRYTVTRYTLSLSLSLHCHEVYSLSISLATLSRSIPSLYLSRYTVTRYTLSLSLLLFNYKNSTTRVCLCQSGHHPYLIETQLVLTMI